MQRHGYVDGYGRTRQRVVDIKLFFTLVSFVLHMPEGGVCTQ